MVATAAACGSGSGRPSGSVASPPASSYRTDASGQVACSARSLPQRYAGPVDFDASLGGVSARFHAVAVRQQYDQWLTGPELTLAAAGKKWQTTPKPATAAFRHQYSPLEMNGPARVSGYLCLVRFAPAHLPPAVLLTYGGGAHCCTTVRLYDLESRHVSQLELGNMGARIVLAGTQPVLETRDDAFSYAFTDFADSGAPIRLYQPTAGGFGDVTRQFPAMIRADARSLWQLAAKRVSKLGFYASWAADQEMLGKDAHVWQTMRGLDRAGKLTAPQNLQEPGWPQGKAYISKLRGFLRDHGYLS
jgi:hypothetical protein